MKNTFKTIDEYYGFFPEEVQIKFELLRKTIHSQNSEIEEYIGYQMPGFKYLKKPLVYFAGYKNHIGLYPGAETVEKFKEELSKKKYKISKGTIQFTIEEELPLNLIQKMIQFRMMEIEQKKS